MATQLRHEIKGGLKGPYNTGFRPWGPYQKAKGVQLSGENRSVAELTRENTREEPKLHMKLATVAPSLKEVASKSQE